MREPVSFRIRPAEPGDAKTVAAFNSLCAQESEELVLDPATVHAGTKAALADHSRCRYFLAEDEAGPVGQVMITREWSDWRNAWIWWLQSVYVVRRARRRGAFTALLRHIEEIARAEGVASIRLYVEEHNDRAERTYLSLGFRAGHYRLLEKVLADA